MRNLRRRGRSLALGFMVLLAFAGVGLVTAISGGASEATDITGLPIRDSLARSESPLSSGGQWKALQWASSSGGTASGVVTTSGWRALDAQPAVNGAYWTSQKFGEGGKAAAATLTMAVDPELENRSVSLWLNMPEPDKQKSGYQLTWTRAASGGAPNYSAVLSVWKSGAKTVLAEKTLSIPAGTTMAISDKGETVTAWSGSTYAIASVMSASDSTYASGYAGIEASGNQSRSNFFRAGDLPEAPPVCEEGKRLYAGKCWDREHSELAATSAAAQANCAARGGWLPPVLELRGFSGQPGIVLAVGDEWTGDPATYSGPDLFSVHTVAATGTIAATLQTNTRKYRCVFPQNTE